jgi:hypothetical protein
MKFEELSNSEISVVYYNFKRHLDEMNAQLDNKMFSEKVNIETDDPNAPPVRPIVVVVERITDDEVAAIRSSHYYQNIKSLVDKLQPVVELIEEAEPEIKKNLQNE